MRNVHLYPTSPPLTKGRKPKCTRDERGIALILALLVLSLLVALILEFDAEARRELKEAVVFRDSLRAAALSRAAAQAVRAVLKEDLRRKKFLGVTADALTDFWSQPLTNFPIGDGAMSGRIEDERGKLNLNLLSGQTDDAARKAVIARFRRLFEAVNVEPLLVDALLDWVDEDDVQQPAGAESAYYEGLTPPYRCANSALQSFGELYLIKGFTDEVVQRLRPYISIYPSSGGASLNWVNINTADARVLYTLDARMTMPLAQAVVQARPFRTIQEADAVAGFEPIAKALRLADAYRINSDTFSATATLTTSEVTKVLTMVLMRTNEQGDNSVISLRSD